jgi:hypothetical protein
VSPTALAEGVFALGLLVTIATSLDEATRTHPRRRLIDSTAVT